jgi:hypothetical protein
MSELFSSLYFKRVNPLATIEHFSLLLETLDQSIFTENDKRKPAGRWPFSADSFLSVTADVGSHLLIEYSETS